MSGVVMFVFNDCTTDARVLREAASLAAAGHRVTIMARPRDPFAPVGDRETRDGFEIIRVPIPAGLIWARYPWHAWSSMGRRVRDAFTELPTSLLMAAAALVLGILSLPWVAIRAVWVVKRRLRGPGQPTGGGLLEWLARWQLATLGWAKSAARAAPDSAVYHGHDLTGLPAAMWAAEPRAAHLVYDSHEIFLESGANARRPRWARAMLARMERRGMARADALVTVNEALAEELSRRYAPRRVLIVRNCPPRWTPPDPRPDLIRDATGIPGTSPIALYHGGFSLHRGLETLAAALLQPGPETVHAVYLGYGGLRPMLEEMTRDPAYRGRLHVIDAVPLDRLLEWIASADVGVMTSLPSTLNHLLATPNKLFECLAAGVPVVASDFALLRRVVLENPEGPLGVVCDPTDVTSVAAAIRSIVTSDPTALARFSERCLAAAHDRWNWETEVAGLLDLYAELDPA